MARIPNNKTFTSPGHIKTDKEGSGLYSEVNFTHHAGSKAAMPLVLEAVQSIEIKSGSVFTIVDYGTGDGGISISLIYACVKAIREKYGEELPINVIYEDQPTNDFKSVFMRIHGLIPCPSNFFLDFPNVFVMASGTNFFSQCFPRESVTLGISTNAMHWLRDKPCNITGALHHHLITDPEEKEKFRKQAEKDWELILMNRAAELMPGARLVLVLASAEKQNECDTSWGLKFLWNTLKCLSDEGILTKEEMKNTNFLAYRRSLDEFKKPFKCKDSPVNQAGLELVSIETREIPCHFHQKWIKDKGDAEEHAKQFVTSVRTWSYSIFMSGLSDSRSPEEKTKILDEFYRRYEAEVAKHPEDHGFGLVYAYLVIQKRL